MANERMYLKCNICGKAIYLGSHLGGPWEIGKDDDEIASFFRRHYDCMLKTHEDANSHKNDFSIAYEGDNFTLEYINTTPDYVRKEIEEYKDSINPVKLRENVMKVPFAFNPAINTAPNPTVESFRKYMDRWGNPEIRKKRQKDAEDAKDFLEELLKENKEGEE